ncbi:MAG: hypothetical protein PHY05_03840 [Methanothrix sp.]|nr:hypothetical protein [Methanothrix sp.]
MPQDASSLQGFRILLIVSRPLDLPDLPGRDRWLHVGLSSGHQAGGGTVNQAANGLN